MKILFILTFLFTNTLSTCSAQINGKKLVRVKENADGTTTELEQKDAQTIVRRTLTEKANGERIIGSQTIYIKARDGLLRNAKISDGSGKPLFKIRYGYHKVTGKLIMEELFDAEGDRRNAQGAIIPLQRLYYKYDAHGNRSKPYAITTTDKGRVENFVTWKKHIKERMNKHQLNFEGNSTILSDKEMEKLEKANRNLNSKLPQ